MLIENYAYNHTFPKAKHIANNRAIFTRGKINAHGLYNVESDRNLRIVDSSVGPHMVGGLLMIFNKYSFDKSYKLMNPQAPPKNILFLDFL